MTGAVKGLRHAPWAVSTCGSLPPPPRRASKALALHTLHSITGTSYRVSFLLRCEWSRSFHPAMNNKLVGIFSQAVFLVH